MRMFLATLLTAAAAAAPVTGSATDVTTTSATLNATVDAPATVHFEYTASTGVALTTEPQAVDAGDVAVPISGLTAETTYRYKVWADGTPGEERTFTTSPNPLPPHVSGQRIGEVTPQSALATASVNAHGNPTTYTIEYGTGTRYGSETAPVQVGSGTTDAAISTRLTGLRPYTRYHWRVVATNAAGVTRGRDKSFRTDRLPTGVTLGLARGRVPWGGELRLGGRVSGAGTTRMTVALEQQRFPLDQGFTPVDTTRTGGDGGYLFIVRELWTTTRYRVSTRTSVVATSPVATARSAVKVGIRARHSRRRARIQGTILPGVHGTAVLQRKRGRRWKQVRQKTLAPSDELRTHYRFKVPRPRKRRHAVRYRVRMAPVRGAHVRGWSRSVKVRPRR